MHAFVALAATVGAVNVSIPLSTPDGAPTLSGSLIGLSIEQDRWTDWSGTHSRNEYFYNTLNNIVRITGVPPDIRIGANSEDHTNYNPYAKFAETIFPAYTAITPYPEATNITVGDSYYATARFLPRGTHVTWGVNLGSNNITAAYLETQAIVKAFSSPAMRASGIHLDYLEIGNEPDLYKNNGLRPNTYSSTQLVADWIRFATNLTEAARPLWATGTKFLAGSLAASSHALTGFSPQALFSQGLLDSEPGKLIGAFSQHRYSGSFCTGNGGLLQELMTKANVRSNLTIYQPDSDAVHEQGLDYIMGETNSYACHGAPGVSNTAGAALWALDYALFAPLIGMSRVLFHDGIGFKYNLIQPVTLTRSILDGSPLDTPLPPHIQPEYYAAIVAAEAIGDSGITKSAEISIDHPRISGYAFFEHGRLMRAVFINSKAFLQGDVDRNSVHLDIDFVDKGKVPKFMTVKRLAIGHADDTSGVRWGGQTYETKDGKVGGHLHEDLVAVEDGLDIADTEAVLVAFK